MTHKFLGLLNGEDAGVVRCAITQRKEKLNE